MLIRVPPSEWVVRVGWGGRLLGATPGASFWLWPWESYLRFPSTIQWMLFSASQITRENQGVDVKGAFSWRIVDPLRAYQNLNMQRMSAEEVRELLGPRSTSPDCAVDHGPLMRTTLLIRQLAESVTRNAIANMSVEEAIRNRRTIVDTLTAQIDNVISAWGVAITSIEIVDVYISSKELFGHMQAEYRERLRREAKAQQIAAEEDIAQRQLAVKARLGRIEHDHALGDIALKTERGQREAEMEQQRQNALAAIEKEKTVAGLERKALESQALLRHRRDELQLLRERMEALDAYKAQQLLEALPTLVQSMKPDKTTVYANSLPGATIEGIGTTLASLAEMVGVKLS